MSNLSGKISAFAPIIRLKMKPSLLGANQQRAFKDIKRYLYSPSIMKTPMVGILFRLYIAVEDAVIKAALMQVTDGKEHIITYLSQCLVDIKTR
jgi:hypothetical protein